MMKFFSFWKPFDDHFFEEYRNKINLKYKLSFDNYIGDPPTRH